MLKIFLHNDSVWNIDTTVLVNANNTHMRGGSGLNGKIHELAGVGLLEELKQAAPGGAPTAHIVSTSACQLNTEIRTNIWHVAGPRFNNNSIDYVQLIKVYTNLVQKMFQDNIDSIAVPGISMGIFGFPIISAAKLSVMGLLLGLEDQLSLYLQNNADPHKSPDKSWHFVMYKPEEYNAFKQALRAIQHESPYGVIINL